MVLKMMSKVEAPMMHTAPEVRCNGLGNILHDDTSPKLKFEA